MPAQRSEQIKWPELIFAADAAGEQFDDVQFITAKLAFVGEAAEAATQQLMDAEKMLTLTEIKAEMAKIIDAGNLYVREYVEIAPDGITVCANVPNTTDDHVLTAHQLVYIAIKQLNGEFGTVFIGDQLRWTTAELAEFF